VVKIATVFTCISTKHDHVAQVPETDPFKSGHCRGTWCCEDGSKFQQTPLHRINSLLVLIVWITWQPDHNQSKRKQSSYRNPQATRIQPHLWLMLILKFSPLFFFEKLILKFMETHLRFIQRHVKLVLLYWPTVHRHPSKYMFQKASNLVVFIWQKNMLSPIVTWDMCSIFSGLEVTSEIGNKIMLF